MGKLSRFGRMVVAGGALVTGFAAFATGSPASADPDLPLNQSVQATTHLAKLDRDIANTGTFIGNVDLGTGEIVADLSLGATETELDLVGVPLAKIGVQVVPTQQAVGHIDFSDFSVDMTTVFNIKILYVKAFGIFNVAGNNCQTSTPVTLQSTGTFDIATFTTTLTGDFEIPEFSNCGIATLGINLLVPGPDNTFSSVASPATS